MRISELANAKRGDVIQFKSIRSKENSYLIKVLGKGNVVRDVIIPQKLMYEINEYFQHRGYPDFFSCEEDTPIIGPVITDTDNKYYKSVRPKNKSISINRLHEILKSFFKEAADELSRDSMDDAINISKASTHWLRHTCGSHMGANNVDVRVIQILFGHKSIETTTPYTKTEREILLSAVESHSQNPLI